jgi:hypothetical protein
MKTIWFKGCFVADILAGVKRDTLRTPSTRLPAHGDVVAFSVGPRAPFAQARITRVRTIEVSTIPLARRQQLGLCYAGVPPRLVKLTFQLVRPES